MNTAFFEDPLYTNFDPLSLSHPVFALLCGTSPIYAKWVKALKPKEHSFYCRPHLASLLAAQTKRKVNSVPRGDTIFINGRFMPDPETASAAGRLKPGEALFSGDSLLAFRLISSRKLAFEKNLLSLYDPDSFNRVQNLFRARKVQALESRFLWDLVDHNGEMIAREFADINRTLKTWGKVDSKVSIIKKAAVAIMPEASVGPGVIIDASEGPVIIDRGTVVEPLTFIKGPAYIGPSCRLTGGKIREGCSFGPVCRVGGEVEETILLGYDNKYHEGFLGHTYLGEWVNLGAMTTNSDLKNNYGEITVMVHDNPVDTGRIKVGCFIGDHTKTGIGTLLNTGITIGFSCNLYGGTLFADRSIRSFSWGTPGNLVEYKLDKAAQTASSSMRRRDIEFGPLQEKLFNDVFKLSGRVEAARKAKKPAPRR